MEWNSIEWVHILMHNNLQIETKLLNVNEFNLFWMKKKIFFSIILLHLRKEDFMLKCLRSTALV